MKIKFSRLYQAVLVIALLGLICSEVFQWRVTRTKMAAGRNTQDSLDQRVFGNGAVIAKPGGGDELTKSGPKQSAEARSVSEQDSLWAAFAAARLCVEPLTAREASLPSNAGVRFFAQNPGEQINARFLEGGTRLESGRGGQWSASLHLSDAGDAQPRLADGKVEFHHANGIVESYENRYDGLEHTFLVSRPLGRDGELRVSIALKGVTAQQDESGSGGGVVFTDSKGGEPVLGYGELKVWDASGRVLEAHYEPQAAGLDIVVAAADAVYPVTIDPLITSQEAKLGPDFTGDGEAADQFGGSVAVHGDTVLIGAPLDDTSAGEDAGSVYVFTRSGGVWNRQTKLTAKNSSRGDQFGSAVALDGERAVIGAPVPSELRMGSAYIFQRIGSVWSQEAHLTPREDDSVSRFGKAVAISGESVLIGMEGFDFWQTPGSAHVFARVDGTWSRQAVLIGNDTAYWHGFGSTLALSGDRALIGAPYVQTAGALRTGKAYVFVRNGITWSQETTFMDSHPQNRGTFGTSVALDGTTALIGARGSELDVGSAFVFTRQGAIWTQQARLVASVPEDAIGFGRLVALHGSTALVAANGTYVFTRNGTAWSQQARLALSGSGEESRFVSAIALDEDTAMLARQVTQVNADEVGIVHIYSRTGGVWTEQAQLSDGRAPAGNLFGNSVAISVDTALVGVPLEDTAAGVDAGSVYVFTRSSTHWSRQARLTASDAAAGQGFGHAVALDGETAVVGRYAEYHGSGAYVFTRTGGVWSEEARLSRDAAITSSDFGYSVSVSGSTVLVGARAEYTGAAFVSAGAYIFTRVGSMWSREARLTSTAENFGQSVAVFGDTALVGTPRPYYSSEGEGTVHAYHRSGDSWSEEATLSAPTQSSPHFGWVVAGDGDTAVVGAPHIIQGSVLVFTRSGSGLWARQAQILSGYSTGSNEGFGHAVALDDHRLVVGEPNYQFTSGRDVQGRAYVYDRVGTEWAYQAVLAAVDERPGDEFGISVAVSGNTALVGAYLDDTRVGGAPEVQVNHGSAYVFRFGPQPEIAVSHGLTEITSGDFTPASNDGTDFGGMRVASKVVTKTFTLTNTGATALTLSGSPRISLSGSPAFLVSQGPASGVLAAGKGKLTFTLSFLPSTPGQHNATVSIASNDPDEGLFQFGITGWGAVPPTITAQPLNQLVLLGAEAQFAFSSTPSPTTTQQWLKGSAKIAGATANPFRILKTKASDAGAYRVVVQNGINSQQTSQTAYLGLVTPSVGTRVLKAGGTMSLKCAASVPSAPGVILRHAWLHDGTPLSNGSQTNGAVISGADKATLTISKIGPDDAGAYTCRVTLDTPGNDPELTQGDTMVHVVGEPPTLDTIPLPPVIAVSQLIDVTLSASQSPTGFSARGLPTGLKLDTKTGRIQGRVVKPTAKTTAGADIPIKIVFTASNPFGTSQEVTLNLIIEAIAPGAVGTFHGLVSRSGPTNAGMGGMVQVTVTGTGAVSGSAVLLGQKHPLMGTLNPIPGQAANADLVVKRTPATLGDLILKITIAPSGEMVRGTMSNARFAMLLGTQILGNPDIHGLANGPAAEALFSMPTGIALRADGSVYIADTTNQLIRFFDAKTGDVTTYAGSPQTWGSENDWREDALFDTPSGLALDAAGNLFIADEGSSTIRKITPAGMVSTFAGKAYEQGADDGGRSEARFLNPAALCFDPAGNLYVADSGFNNIRKITPTGMVTTLAGDAEVAGHKDGQGKAAHFQSPVGIVYDSVLKALFVADRDNFVIRKVTLTGAVTTYAGAPGAAGRAEGLFVNTRFMGPESITTLGDGRLIVGDTLLVLLHPSGISGVVSEMLDTEGLNDDPTALAYSTQDQKLYAVHTSLNGVAEYTWSGQPSVEAQVLAQRISWTPSMPLPTEERGLWNVAIRAGAEPEYSPFPYPRGHGYAQASISSTGAVAWTGAAADGVTFTSGSFLAADRGLPLHVMLSKNTGSIQGRCLIDPATLSVGNDTTILMDWLKLAQATGGVDRVHPAGLYLSGLSVTGGKYPAGNLHSYLGLSSSPADMVLDFSPDGIDAFQQPFTLTAPSAVQVPFPVFSLSLKIDPKTGIYNGSFKRDTLPRRTPFSGLLIHDQAQDIRKGFGHYLNPEYSDAASPLLSLPVELRSE